MRRVCLWSRLRFRFAADGARRHALEWFSNADANNPTLSSVGERLQTRQRWTRIVQM